MNPDRERPLILLPLAAALAVYGLAKSDFILPALSLLLMAASYRLPSPAWWRGRAVLDIAAALLLGPAYLYQRALLTPGLGLYIFWPSLVNTATVMAVCFLPLIWYLPPAPNRKWALLLISFAIAALAGNYQQPYMYHPAIASYLISLLAFFKADQKHRQERSGPVPGLLYYSILYLGFLAGAAALGLFLIGLTARSESMVMALGDELNRLYDGGDSLRLSSTWQSGSVSGWEGSDEAIMVIEGEGPIPEYLRLQVFYRYDYQNKRGSWFEGGKESPVSASGTDTRPLVIGPGTTRRWKYQVLSVAPLVKELPLPTGASRVWSDFGLSYYPESGLIERWRQGPVGETREYEMEGGDAPLPDCGEACRTAALELPDHLRQALQPKARAIIGAAATGRDRARAVVRHFSRYNYSLEPQHRMGSDPVIEFMAGDTATGLCRDFAEAAALLLRAVDVPARAVSGILVTESTGEGRRSFYIKRRNLHAWIEVYCQEEGRWELFDPTPATGLEAALGRNNLFTHWLGSQWDRMRFMLHRAANFVRDLTRSDAVAALTTKRIAVTVGSLILVIAAVYLWRKRGRVRFRKARPGPGGAKDEQARPPANPAGQAYEEFLTLLADRGIIILERDTAAEILERIAGRADQSGLSPAACREFVALYRSVRFRRTTGPELKAAVFRLAELLAEFKSVDAEQNLMV